MNETTATSINERAAEEFYRKGIDADSEGSHEKAVAFFEQALGENPDHEQACFRLAMLYDRRAEDAKAIELYERLTTSPPVSLNALINLAILYEDNNHYVEAHRCLSAVIRTNPNHERARMYMRDVQSAMSQYYEEEEHHNERHSPVMDVPITDFELSVRARNCLKKMNIRTIGDLLRITERELLSYKNFGDTSLTEIKEMLANKGLSLGQDAEPHAAVSHSPSILPQAETADAAAPETLNRPIAEVELSVRSRKALQRLNIATLGELAAKTEDELLGCKNFGATSLGEIKQQLEVHGLSLRKLPE